MEPFEVLILIVAAAIGIPLAIMALVLLWPLLLCWHMGYPVVGVCCEVVWLASLK